MPGEFNPTRYKVSNATVKTSQDDWDQIFGKRCPLCRTKLTEVRGHLECRSDKCRGRIVEGCCGQ